MEAVVSNTASSNEDFESDKNFAAQIKAEVWAGWNGSQTKDELGDKVAIAVANIEKELRPHLKRS